MNTIRWILFRCTSLMLLLFIFFAFYSCSQGNSTAQDKATLRIAGNLPLSGPIAAWSGQYPNGFRLGIEDACKQYGIPVSSVYLNFQDNAGKPATAMSIMQQQLLSNYQVYISGTSDVSSAVMPNIEATNIPHFVAAFDAYLVRNHKNLLRIMPHFKTEGPLYVDYAKHRKAQRIYILSLNNAATEEEYSSIIVPKLRESGIEIEREVYDFNTQEFKTMALKVEKWNPDLVFVSGYSFHIQQILSALRDRSLLEDGKVLCNMDFVDLLYNGSNINEFSGVSFICPLFEIPGEIQSVSDWKNRYKSQFAKSPSYVEAYAYETARILVKSFVQHKTVDISTIRSVLPYDGIVGKVELDQDGDIISTLTIAKIASDGSVLKLD